MSSVSFDLFLSPPILKVKYWCYGAVVFIFFSFYKSHVITSRQPYLKNNELPYYVFKKYNTYASFKQYSGYHHFGVNKCKLIQEFGVLFQCLNFY